MLTQFIRDTFAGMPVAVRPLAILAGGALRAQFDGTEVKDRDLFFRSDNDYLAAYEAFKCSSEFVLDQCDPNERYPSFKRVDDGRIYQLVGLYFHETPELLARSFDFRCCGMVAWCLSCQGLCSERNCKWPCCENELYLVPGSTQDAELLQLTPQVRQSAERIAKRIERYVLRGYRLCAGFHELIARMPIAQSGY